MTDMLLWTAEEICSAVGGTRCLETGTPLVIDDVVIDSRQAGPMTLFVALCGDRIDAHQFVPDLMVEPKGLFLVVKGHKAIPEDLASDPRLIYVADTLEALWALAKAARQRCQGLMFAITGSVGKTSTKEMLAHILNQQGWTTASRGNLNNHYGVPLSCARMPRDTEFGVFELGMNHAGELRALTQIVLPHIVIITQVAPAHMAFFDTLADVAKAKSEIIEGVVDGGAVILNHESPHFDVLQAKVKSEASKRAHGLSCFTLGYGNHADAQLLSTQTLGVDQGLMTRVTARVFGQIITYDLRLLGTHQVMNSLASLLAYAASGKILVSAIKDQKIALERAGACLSHLSGLSGRGKIKTYPWQDGQITLIDESYNASPSAVKAALSVLKQIPILTSGRRIAILGDMLEMGQKSTDFHQALRLDCQDIDKIYAVGAYMTKMVEKLPEKQQGGCVLSSQDLREKLIKDLRSGDIVLIKGSLGMKMSILVGIFQQT